MIKWSCQEHLEIKIQSMLTKRVLIRIKNKLKQACTHSKNVNQKL